MIHTNKNNLSQIIENSSPVEIYYFFHTCWHTVDLLSQTPRKLLLGHESFRFQGLCEVGHIEFTNCYKLSNDHD